MQRCRPTNSLTLAAVALAPQRPLVPLGNACFTLLLPTCTPGFASRDVDDHGSNHDRSRPGWAFCTVVKAPCAVAGGTDQCDSNPGDCRCGCCARRDFDVSTILPKTSLRRRPNPRCRVSICHRKTCWRIYEILRPKSACSARLVTAGGPGICSHGCSTLVRTQNAQSE
jgi:hypothetical protein